MKIGVGDTNVPRDEAIRSDLDFFLGHNEGPIQQREIANRACAILAEGKRTPGIARNVFTNQNCPWRFVAELSEDLRALTIKSFVEFHVGRDWVGPPITFHVPICPYVA